MMSVVPTLINWLAVPRHFAALIAIYAAFSLGFALIAEHFFNLKPCVLCLYQRIPFAVALLVGIAGFIKPHRLFTALIGLSFAANIGIAGFHTGVERGWWKGTDSCGGTIDISALTIEEIRAHILSAPTARCDEIPWELFGLSMTNYVLISSVLIVGFVVYALLKKGQTS